MSTLRSANNNVKCFSQHNLLATTITKRPFSCCGKKNKQKNPQKNKGGSFIEIMLSTSYTAKSSYVYMQNQNKKQNPPNYYLKKRKEISPPSSVTFLHTFIHFVWRRKADRCSIPLRACSLNHFKSSFCTLVAWGVLRTCTVLGDTPLGLILLYRANLLFRLPRSPLGREPLYLSEMGQGGEKDSKLTVIYFICVKMLTASIAAKRSV